MSSVWTLGKRTALTQKLLRCTRGTSMLSLRSWAPPADLSRLATSGPTPKNDTVHRAKLRSTMATTSFGGTAAASATSVTKRAPKSSTYLPLCPSHKLSFRLSHRPKLRFLSKGLQSSWKHSIVVRAQLNEVSVDGSSKSAASSSEKSEGPKSGTEDAKQSAEPSPAPLASEESISEFITQVAGLVKLVDSRDIVELELKQLDCELLIRKKEALPPPPSPPPVMITQPHPLQSVAPAPSAPATPPAPAPAPAALPAAAPPVSAAPKSSNSSLPPLKCPMAGTFYRSPAPGEPPFVKVGDKVQKGQVLCIIEAMKLMNEIEADQSGTLVEIIAEDGKPVSVDTPLFVIEP